MALRGKKSFVMVTGASRGIGKGIAIEFAKNVADGSVLLLLARSEEALKESREVIMSLAPQALVEFLVVDLSKPDSYDFEAEILKILKDLEKVASDFEHAIIVHNAGSIGDITKRALEIDNLQDGLRYYTLNLLSPMLLNTAFFRIFGKSVKLTRTVLNLSSLCGVQPFKSFSFYCSGKAARDMFFKVLALEEPDISVLNYAPGPVDTEMVNDIVNKSWDKSLAEFNENMRETGKILTAEQTCCRLVKILNEGKFKSGDHVDYFDDE